MLCYAVCVHIIIAQIALCQFSVAADPFHTPHFFFDSAFPHQKSAVAEAIKLDYKYITIIKGKR